MGTRTPRPNVCMSSMGGGEMKPKLTLQAKLDLAKLAITAIFVPQSMVILTIILLWKMRQDRLWEERGR